MKKVTFNFILDWLQNTNGFQHLAAGYSVLAWTKSAQFWSRNKIVAQKHALYRICIWALALMSVCNCVMQRDRGRASVPVIQWCISNCRWWTFEQLHVHTRHTHLCTNNYNIWREREIGCMAAFGTQKWRMFNFLARTHSSKNFPYQSVSPGRLLYAFE